MSMKFVRGAENPAKYAARRAAHAACALRAFPHARKERAEETPLGRIGTAAEVADSILYLCSERASFVTGQVLGVTGGF